MVAGFWYNRVSVALAHVSIAEFHLEVGTRSIWDTEAELGTRRRS